MHIHVPSSSERRAKVGAMESLIAIVSSNVPKLVTKDIGNGRVGVDPPVRCCE